ncbi:hypothetical protein C8Q80DRAFT_545056 [Daedaleopsis nitida]|nr:hypothetical protein C8Q80DRAFT_545056 [Daedaleopsis nitida]
MCAATQHHDALLCASQPPFPSNGFPSPLNSINREPSPSYPASQHPQPLELEPADTGHNLVTTLAAQGVKIRDFAYENTLPPVTTVPRFSVQAQPRSRALKRVRDMVEGHDDGEESDEEDPNITRTFYIDSNGTGVSHGYRYRKKSAVLGRTLTEPADDLPPSQGFNTRAQGFAQPSHQPPVSPRLRYNGALLPSTPQRGTGRSPNCHLSSIDTNPQSQTSVQGESQETESWIDTPLVTPNGSIQWPVQNTSAIPASQLESVLPQLPDPEAEANVTLSQLGFSPERSQQPTSSPAGTPSRVRLPQLPPPAEFHPSPRASAAIKSRPSSSSPTRRTTRSKASPTPLQAAPARRYDLRQRAPASKPPPAPRATSRTRASSHALAKDKLATVSAPPAKKRKITPPPPSPPLPSGRGRRTNGAVKENR